jgi:hypothetical protein
MLIMSVTPVHNDMTPSNTMLDCDDTVISIDPEACVTRGTLSSTYFNVPMDGMMKWKWWLLAGEART